MTYKISYPQDWDGDGTHYDQLINIRLTPMEFDELNRSIVALKFDIAPKVVKSGSDMDILCYLKEFGWGKNYTTHTQRDYVCDWFGILSDKRLLDRNTMIRFVGVLNP